jgi:hypothetical protein
MRGTQRQVMIDMQSVGVLFEGSVFSGRSFFWGLLQIRRFPIHNHTV